MARRALSPLINQLRASRRSEMQMIRGVSLLVLGFLPGITGAPTPNLHLIHLILSYLKEGQFSFPSIWFQCGGAVGKLTARRGDSR